MGSGELHTKRVLAAQPAQLAAELAAPRREEARGDGPGDGVHGAERDHEFGVVAADTGDDDEHGALDGAWGVDSDRYREDDQGAEGVSGRRAGRVPLYVFG